jgi:4-amino-4-deoxy-L-arabinose transferase-like glycosyltransferase
MFTDTIMPKTYRKRVTILIFATLLFRFWLGQTFELSEPEAYSWLKGKNLDWGYWDQGAGIPWLAALGSFLFGDTELGLRCITAALYASMGFILFLTTRLWYNPQNAFYCVLLYLITPLYAWKTVLLNEATVSLALMALALYGISFLLHTSTWRGAILAGLASAAGITVAWSNLTWILGLGLYYWLNRRSDRPIPKRRSLLIAGMTLLGFIPSIIWHFNMGLFKERTALFIQKITAAPGQFQLTRLLEFFTTQFWLLGPGLTLALILALIYIRRAHTTHHISTLLLCFSLPGFLLATLFYAIGCPHPYWEMVFYYPALIVAVSVWAHLTKENKIWRALLLITITATLAQSIYGYFTTKENTHGLREKYFISVHSWQSFTDQIQRISEDSGTPFIITDHPHLAAILTFYLQAQGTVYLTPERARENQFQFWPGFEDYINYDALMIFSRDSGPSPDLAAQFRNIEPLSIEDAPDTFPHQWRYYIGRGYNQGHTPLLDPPPTHPQKYRNDYDEDPLPKEFEPAPPEKTLDTMPPVFLPGDDTPKP